MVPLPLPPVIFQVQLLQEEDSCSMGLTQTSLRLVTALEAPTTHRPQTPHHTFSVQDLSGCKNKAKVMYQH